MSQFLIICQRGQGLQMHIGISGALKPTCWNLIPYSQHKEQNDTNRGHWHGEAPSKLLHLASSKASSV